MWTQERSFFGKTLKVVYSHIIHHVRLRIVSSKTQIDIAPIFWDDNYFTLFQFESTTINVIFQSNEKTNLVVELWNNISTNYLTK